VNYFDVAPSYGNAEERLGPALETYRRDIFLACKTEKQNGAEARASLEASLSRLKTDHFDLFQLHAVTTEEDVRTILGAGGALEALVKARERGLIRFLGFSAHSESAALALMEAFPFDSILFPVNWAAWLGSGFGRDVLDVAGRKGLPVLALKALAKRALAPGEGRVREKAWYAPVDSYAEASLALRFTLSRPGVVAALSPGHMDLFRWACEAAESFRPPTPEYEAALGAEARTTTGVFPIA
jgi:aryl-alcohol dehydrogenase-like predicted oxidoreductase